jgi:hypothetical protein
LVLIIFFVKLWWASCLCSPHLGHDCLFYWMFIPLSSSSPPPTWFWSFYLLRTLVNFLLLFLHPNHDCLLCWVLTPCLVHPSPQLWSFF